VACRCGKKQLHKERFRLCPECRLSGLQPHKLSAQLVKLQRLCQVAVKAGFQKAFPVALEGMGGQGDDRDAAFF